MKNKFFFTTTFIIVSICASGTAFSLALPRNQYNHENLSKCVENAEKHKKYVGPLYRTEANGKSSWAGTGSLGQVAGLPVVITAAHCVDGSKEGYIEIEGKRYVYTEKNLSIHPGYENKKGWRATSTDVAFFPIDPKNISPGLQLPQIKPVGKGDVGQTEEMEFSGHGCPGMLTKKGLKMTSVFSGVDIPTQKAGKKEMSLVHSKVTEKRYAQLPEEKKKQMKEAGLESFPYRFESIITGRNYNKPGYCTVTAGDSGAPYYDKNGDFRAIVSWGTGECFENCFKEEKEVSGAAPITEDVVAWMARTASSQGHKPITAEDLRKALEFANQEPALPSAPGPDKINIPAGQAVVVQ